MRRSTRLDSSTVRWLRAAVAPGADADPWPMAGVQPPVGLVRSATLHGVEGWVRRRAHETGREAQSLGFAVAAAVTRHQRALSDLLLVAHALDHVGVDWLTVKGPALVTRYYESPDLRSYVDLDVLVRPRDVEVAVEALEDAGCRVLDTNWPLLHRLGVHELRLLAPSGGLVDLHWSLMPWERGMVDGPDADTLFARSETVPLGGVGARTLDWADALVHLALHAAGGGGHRLIWCTDLRAVLQSAGRGAVSGVLLARADEWRAGPACALMLGRMRTSLGVALPDELVRGLATSAWWRAAVEATDVVAPFDRTTTGRSLSRLVAGDAAARARPELVGLMGRAIAAARRPARTPTPLWVLDAADPRSPLHPAGSEEDRRRFFRSVDTHYSRRR